MYIPKLKKDQLPVALFPEVEDKWSSVPDDGSDIQKHWGFVGSHKYKKATGNSQVYHLTKKSVDTINWFVFKFEGLCL
jgi:putative salt-induced outer membrane protein YdiY